MYNPSKHKEQAARPQPSQARGKERVRIILAAALELFKEDGIEKVTTNDIAERAHIPIGSLYRYYPNKDAIIAALTEAYVQDVTKIFDDVSQHPLLAYLSWDEILLLMVDGWVHYSRSNGPFSFLSIECTDPQLRAQNQPTWDAFITSFTAVLTKRCPELQPVQALICFNLSLAAVEMGTNDHYYTMGGPAMYHEAVGAVAAYMLRICGSTEHHANSMLS